MMILGGDKIQCTEAGPQFRNLPLDTPAFNWICALREYYNEESKRSEEVAGQIESCGSSRSYICASVV